jgi:serine/threonine-protein kinase
MAHIIQTPPPASEAAPSVSPLLDAPLLKMLDKDPASRPSSAGEAVAALRRAAEQAGIELSTGPLRLPRPEPLQDADGASAGEADTLLDFPLTEPGTAVATPMAAPARPLWPFALGLIALGALLGFVVLRGPSSSAAADPAPAADATPAADSASVRASQASAVPTSDGSPAPRAVPEPPPSAAPAMSRPSAVAKDAVVVPRVEPKRVKSLAPPSARIPTDLENPF